MGAAAAISTPGAGADRRVRGRAALPLRPGIPERHGAVEHGLAGRVVAQIRDEVAVPLELERLSPAAALPSAGSTKAVITRFESGLRSSSHVRSTGSPASSSTSSPATTVACATATSAAMASTGAPGGRRAPGKRHGEEPVVEPHFRRQRVRGRQPVDVALDLARIGAGRAGARGRDRTCSGRRRHCPRHPSRRRRSARCRRSAAAPRRPERGGNIPSARPPGSRRARSRARARTACARLSSSGRCG